MATATLPKKLNRDLKEFVVQTIYEVLNDPDFGLELNEKVRKRLYIFSTSKKKTVSFSDIKKKYY